MLAGSDPPPIEWINRDSTLPLLLVCEHAGQSVPLSLDSLGLTKEVLDSHRGWDIGVEAVARSIAQILQAPLIMQRYSRLVIDCNRPPGTPGSIPASSDGINIELNAGVSQSERAAREMEIFEPFNRAVEEALAKQVRVAAFSIHSFTPCMQGQDRPWNAGLLTRSDMATAEQMLNYMTRQAPELTLALNQPYQIEDATDWFIPAFAEKYKLAHSLIEIRNDQLLCGEGIDYWAGLLAGAIAQVLEEKKKT